MDKIKLNIVKGDLGSVIIYNQYIKLSNNLFLIRNNGCLLLCELKNSKFNRIASVIGSFMIFDILELKDKNIIISGKKLLQIYNIKNKKFNLIQEFPYWDYSFGELLSMCQLENEKILVNSNLGIIYVIERKKEKYEIIKEIKIERFRHSFEKIGNNKIFLIESFLDNKKSIISILDFNKDTVNKKIINNKYKIDLPLNLKKYIFNLQNGILIFSTLKNELFIFNIKYEEIISIYVLNSQLIEIINYKEDEYLCIFNDNKVALASFKNEFIIKETKLYDKKKLMPLRFIIFNDKIYLYCDISNKFY